MEKNRIRPITNGKSMRMSYSRQKEVLQMPNLIEVQTDSYKWFLDEGLKEVFDDISPITDYSGHLSLEFVDFTLCTDETKYTIEECKERDATYAAPLKVKVRLHNKETDEINEHEIFMGDLPIMTRTGTFVINGAERVIVSQLVRSPGIYYGIAHDKLGKELYSCTVIPNRGAWLEYETDSNDVFYVRVDRTRKVPITVLIRALGIGTNAEIIDLFGEEPKILASFTKDTSENYQEGLLELYKKIRPGEPLAVDSAESLITSMFFDPRRYDLAKVGRYKFNKKLMLKNRITGHTLAEDVVSPMTGEVIAEAGAVVDRGLADAIQNAAVPYVWIAREESDRNIKVLSNMMVDLKAVCGIDPEEVGVTELVYYPVLAELLEETAGDIDELKEAIHKNIHELIPKHITKEDIMASINYNMHLEYGIGKDDDIDHLGNRRIRAVGELLQNQYRIGLSRLERVVRERMTTQDLEGISPQSLINIKPVTAAVKEFFGSSQLSQFMDQNNPLGELTHKRRLSALGPGGLSRDRAGFEVRDVHYTHYGRLCPIETPEGPNIGLISSLCVYAKINDLGFIETPYRKVEAGVVDLSPEGVKYLSAEEEEGLVIAQANAKIDDEGHFVNKRAKSRKDGDFPVEEIENVNLMDVAPNQIASIAASLIPFLEHDDANRALMGSNMMRQAVPIIKPQAPIVGTGLEGALVRDSRTQIVAEGPGVVDFVDGRRIVIKYDQTEEERFVSFDGDTKEYVLPKYKRTNQSTTMTLRPIVRKGQRVEEGEILTEGYSSEGGELALGRNLKVAYMPWKGYNYEDAIVISENIVRNDVFTSVHVDEYSLEVRETKRGLEELTADIPNVSEDATKDLDENGIIRIGARVKPGDILIGKITPKGESDPSPEEKLLRAIFGDKAGDVKDASLKASPSLSGVIIDKKLFQRMIGDRKSKAAGKTILAEIDEQFERKVGDLTDLLIDKLFELTNGKTSQGVKNYLNEDVIPKGVKFTLKTLQNLNYLEINPNKWTTDKQKNDMIRDLLHNFVIKYKEIEGQMKRKKYNATVGDELPSGIIKMAKVYVAKKRKLQIGDKMAGRHGNKGIVSRVVRVEDMPFLADGTPVDICLNPLGVPSRMNLGQIFEAVLGWAGKELGLKFATPIFDGASLDDINAYTDKAGVPRYGTTYLYDGGTGERFDQPATVGVTYFLKLGHMVDDKMHARSIGPYSLITQQPLGGKAQFGGQRFGEMEVWALEAFGAAHILQEILTVKSDDVMGRTKTYEHIVKGEPMPTPGLPESFNVLLHELRGLGLSVNLI